jgi:hypothetical protein
MKKQHEDMYINQLGDIMYLAMPNFQETVASQNKRCSRHF